MKKIIGLYVMLLMVLVCFVGCGGESTEQTDEQIKVSWGGPKNISMLPIVADKKGYFKEAGLNIETKYLQTGKISMDALMSKDVDFSVLVETNVAFIKYQKGADIQVICSIQEKFDDAIVARKDRGINTPKDLEGKTLGLLIATTSHVFADRFIRFYNLDASKIKIVNLSPPSIQASLLSGDIDAGSVWQPFRFNVKKQLGDKIIQFNEKEVYKAYAIIAVRKEFSEKNKSIVLKFIKALIKAEDFIKANQQEAINLLAKDLKIEPEVLTEVWDEYIIGVKLDDGLLKLIKEEGMWIKETQRGFKNKEVPSYSGVIATDFLKEVDQSRVK